MKKEYKFLALFILGIIMVSFFVGVVSALETQAETGLQKFFNKPVVRYIIGIVFGLWDPENVTQLFVGKGSIVVNNVGAIVAYLALWIALLFAFGNILSLFLPTSEWVGWVVGIALTIAAAQLRFVFWLISFFALLTAFLGTFSVFASIILAFVAFFLLSIGTETIRKWAVKRKLAMEGIKAMKGRHRVSQGIKTLGQVGHEIEEAGGL